MEHAWSMVILLQHWEKLIISLITILLVSNYGRLQNYYKGKTHKKTMAIYSDNESDNYVPALEEKPHVPYNGATIQLPGGALQFYEMMQNRRSVRAFKRTCAAALRETIETCIRAAGTAPSGAHTEPWTFCVISELSLKRKIQEIVEQEEEFNYAQRMQRQWVADLRPLQTNHNKPYLADAPFLILVFKQLYSQMPDGRRRQHYYNEISTAIAVGILICALQAAGLNSLVTTPLNCGAALRNLLERPANEKLLMLLPVGYAAADCKVPDLVRKPLDDILIRYYE